MAKYTKEDVLRILEENDVKFIRLQFSDIFGSLKNVAITRSQAKKALDNQCMFDGSSIEGFVQMNLLAAALAGVCLGFLVWNFHPAKVFMGDTGSMFLGGLVVALAFGLRMPVILIFVGIVYVAETMSDIIQIGSVKLTGKRVFKMAPIHHHFEMCGWSEVKIVAVFSAVTALGCIIAVLMVL